MHIRTDRKALLSRIKCILGQVEAIRDSIEEGKDEDSYPVLHLMTSAKGSLEGLIRIFIEGHIREHVVAVSKKEKREEAGDELIKSLRAFLK